MASEVLAKPLPARKPPEERITFEEFCSLLNEDQKADLIDGVIIMATPASLSHESLFGFLYIILGTYVSEKKLGIVLGSRTAVKLAEYQGPEPDLLFVGNPRLDIVKEQHIDGPPDLVVEIISPASRQYDLHRKKEIYSQYGVGEYWLIDPHQQTTQFLRNKGKTWKPLPVDENGIFRSEVIPGFWLRIDWLFAKEPPPVLDVVTAIIKETP